MSNIQPRPVSGTSTPIPTRKTVAKVGTPVTPLGQQGYYQQPSYYAASAAYYHQGAASPTAATAASTSLQVAPTAQATHTSPIPTFYQARHTSYASRMRTGTTLLMQPVVATSNFVIPTSLNVVPTIAPTTRAATSRSTRAVINYADPGSGDEFDKNDDGDYDDASADEDFTGSRLARRDKPMMNAARAGASSTGGLAGGQADSESQQSYLGRQPPNKLITTRVTGGTKHQYFLSDTLQAEAGKSEVLVPIRVEVETDTHRIRDCFLWNLNEELLKPETFAQIFCQDLELPTVHAESISNMIRAQLDEYGGLASLDVGGDQTDPNHEDPDCRVILRIDVQLDNYQLVDHIEWDLFASPDPMATPEAFAKQLTADLGLRGEAVAIIAHAMHEEILKHKKDAIEWGVLVGAGPAVEDAGYRRAQRGPKRLRGVWRDWLEFKDYGPRLELLTPEELERREAERERASRRMRRETSKYQRSGPTARDNRPPRPSRLR